MENTTEKCFEDLVSKITNSQARSALANLLNVSYTSTFSSWVQTGVKAKGMNLVRLRVVLKMFGYDVAEWKELPTALSYVAEALTYNVLSLNQARDGLGYTGDNEVYRQILHSGGMYPSRVEQAKEFVTKIEGDVVRARMEFHTRMELLHPDIAAILPAMSKPAQMPVQQSPESDILSIDQLMEVVSSQIMAILPLIRVFDSDQASPALRAALRKKVGYEVMSEVTLVLRNLTSEKTREQIADSKRKGRIS